MPGAFLINGRSTHAGRVVESHRVVGLLFNGRLPSGIRGCDGWQAKVQGDFSRATDWST